MATVLITQCLQRDFVDPIGPHDPLPNLLHVGYSEAARLLGPEPAAGPLAQLIQWARGLPSDAIDLVYRVRAKDGQWRWLHTTGRTIERNAAAQVQLIEELLDLSAMVAGGLRLNVTRVDVRELVGGAVETVRPAADA